MSIVKSFKEVEGGGGEDTNIVKMETIQSTAPKRIQSVASCASDDRRQ